MERRTFLAGMAGAAASAAGMEILDTHVHFYDPSRPQGVPWPPKHEKLLYRTVLPADLVRLAAPMGVKGAVVVEASVWVEDNQWILDLAEREPFIRGFIGNLPCGTPEFRVHLERFAKNPLFRGIRLNAARLSEGFERPAFVDDLKRLADLGLTLDTVGGPATIPAVLRASDRFPELRIVIDHLPFEQPAAGLTNLKGRARVYAKISNVPRRTERGVPRDLAFYRPALDELWEIFGPDRVVYGSNWPVSERIAPYETALAIVRPYFAEKGAADQYFWENSQKAYRWLRR